MSPICRLIVPIVCLVALLPVQAHAFMNRMPSVGLVILPEAQLRVIDGNQADFDFGHFSSLDLAQVDHAFTLRNEGKEPVAITQMQPSCHCTVSIVEQIAGRKPTQDEQAAPTLAPGQEMVIRVTVQMARQPTGPLSQGVFIFAAGAPGPVGRLNIVGTVDAGLTVMPVSLDFGQVKVGESSSQKVTLIYDGRMVAGAELPPIKYECDPRFESEAGSVIEVTAEGSGTPLDATKGASPMCTKTYVVTVRPTKPGDLVAHLFFAPVNPEDYRGSVPYDRAMDSLRGLSIAVCGQVMEK